jgi:hypothetical protein
MELNHSTNKRNSPSHPVVSSSAANTSATTNSSTSTSSLSSWEVPPAFDPSVSFLFAKAPASQETVPPAKTSAVARKESTSDDSTTVAMRPSTNQSIRSSKGANRNVLEIGAIDQDERREEITTAINKNGTAESQTRINEEVRRIPTPRSTATSLDQYRLSPLMMNVEKGRPGLTPRSTPSIAQTFIDAVNGSSIPRRHDVPPSFTLTNSVNTSNSASTPTSKQNSAPNRAASNRPPLQTSRIANIRTAPVNVSPSGHHATEPMQVDPSLHPRVLMSSGGKSTDLGRNSNSIVNSLSSPLRDVSIHNSERVRGAGLNVIDTMLTSFTSLRREMEDKAGSFYYLLRCSPDFLLLLVSRIN